MLALIAFVVGLGLFYVIKPEFLNLPNPTAQGHDMFLLNIRFVHLLYFLLFAIVVGCLAGMLPAIFLSKLKARAVFNDATKIKLYSGINLRSILIVFQFAMSISLIMCAVLVYNQYKFSLNYDLGYSTENIVNIRVQGDYVELLEQEYAKIPEVVATSKTSMVLGIGGDGLSAGMMQTENIGKPALVSFVDQNFLDMHELELVAGTSFMNPVVDGGDNKYIVVNEGLIRELQLGTPEEAVGKTIFYNGAKVSILGVVKDFIGIALTKKLFDSFAFVYSNGTEQYHSLAVKIQSSNLITTIDKLEKSYQVLDPIHSFEANFYEDKIAKTYEAEKATYTIISFLAFLAISISTLGLLGMAVFNTESRMKEICIRKVLGADAKNLVLLLSRGFLVMIAVAGVIAIPTTLYLVDDRILNDFIFRAEVGLVEMFSGFVIVLLIGVLTITWQTKEAATQNPADLLRDE